MEDGNLLILDYVEHGRLSVDEAVHLIEALAEEQGAEIWLIPLPVEGEMEICLN